MPFKIAHTIDNQDVLGGNCCCSNNVQKLRLLGVLFFFCFLFFLELAPIHYCCVLTDTGMFRRKHMKHSQQGTRSQTLSKVSVSEDSLSSSIP